jgi:hypothetical protein
LSEVLGEIRAHLVETETLVNKAVTLVEMIDPL